VADPHGYRPAPGEIPESPGVYRFRDQHGRVIYVGKAKSLRQRLNSYFADFASLHPRTQMMLTTAAGVEWTVVGTEVEALQLEYSWIKEYDPRFNVKYRDDKSYPYLAVTMGEDFPRVMVMRGAKRKGTKYFGPYSHAWAIRDTVDTLLRVFPDRAALSAWLHRQVLRAVRQADQRRGSPRSGGGLLRFHGRADQPVRHPPRGGDEAGRQGRGVRARRPAPR
jgi:excinuclease ABC subunit C